MATDVPEHSINSNQLLADAAQAIGEGKVDRAGQLLREVLAMAPHLTNAQFLYGVTCLMSGDAPSAVGYLRKAIAQRPDDANVQTYLGCALHDAGLLDEALGHFRQACLLAPHQARHWYNLGKALKQQGRLDAADQAYRRTLALDERHVLACVGVADIATMQGDIARAVAEYRHVLSLQPDRAEAWHGLANLKTVRLSAADVEQLRHSLCQPDIQPDAKVMLGFSLFRALEDQGDYAGAFAALQTANAEKHRLIDWDPAAEHARIGHIMSAFSSPLPPALDPTLGNEVILIISLPRSGSTLVEHILASHPEVEGANEIADLPEVIAEESHRRGVPFPQWVASATSGDWHRLGKDYLARTARWRRERPCFTDKNVTNWPLVGAAMAMLPGARFVHCHRDPVETCFSCYRQLFRRDADFSYDLHDMAAYYCDYERLTAFWLSQYPQRILDFHYEALLRSPEAVIRGLLASLDLPFNTACLAPHQTHRDVLSTASAAQVRQPIRTDTTHSEPYREQLKPLRDQLTR